YLALIPFGQVTCSPAQAGAQTDYENARESAHVDASRPDWTPALGPTKAILWWVPLRRGTALFLKGINAGLFQDSPRPAHILVHLRDERVQIVELRFGAQPLNERDLDGLPVKIAREIEN